MDDTILNISYISLLYNDLLLFSPIYPHARRSLCIVAIISDDTIMADYYSDELRRHKNRGHTKQKNIPHSTDNFFPVQYPGDTG